MLSWLSKWKSILWDLKIEREVRILPKKDAKQYRKRSLYAFSFANIIFKNVLLPIYVPRMTGSNSPFLYLRNSASVLIFWWNDIVNVWMNIIPYNHTWYIYQILYYTCHTIHTIYISNIIHQQIPLHIHD